MRRGDQDSYKNSYYYHGNYDVRVEVSVDGVSVYFFFLGEFVCVVVGPCSLYRYIEIYLSSFSLSWRGGWITCVSRCRYLREYPVSVWGSLAARP